MAKRKSRRTKRKIKSAAVLTIDRPGAMTPQGARRIAAWLRQHADYLAKADTRKRLNDTGPFRARYLYAK